MRSLSLVALLLLLAPAPTLAQALFLQWNDCPPAGVGVRTFACNTNSGSELLIASFSTDLAVNDVNAMEGVIDVVFPDSNLPAWWNFGGCRASTALQFSSSFASGPFTCTSPWPASSAGGLIWQANPSWPGRWRIRVIQAVPTTDAFSLAPEVPYYAFRMILNHSRSTGSGACSGCDIPAGLIFSSLHVVTGTSANDQFLWTPFETRDDHRHFADWQCDGRPVWAWDHNTIDQWSFGPGCTVAARRPTWGSIKNLYR